MTEVQCPSPSKQGFVIELESGQKHSFTPPGGGPGRRASGEKGGWGGLWKDPERVRDLPSPSQAFIALSTSLCFPQETRLVCIKSPGY